MPIPLRASGLATRGHEEAEKGGQKGRDESGRPEHHRREEQDSRRESDPGGHPCAGEDEEQPARAPVRVADEAEKKNEEKRSQPGRRDRQVDERALQSEEIPGAEEDPPAPPGDAPGGGPSGRGTRARERRRHEPREDERARVGDEAPAVLGRDQPEEKRERPGVMEGDRAQVARDRSEEKACELRPEERHRLGDPAPDGQGLGGRRIAAQDEAAQEREDRQRKEENRSPPRAGRELALGPPREDLDEMGRRRHEKAEAREGMKRPQEESPRDAAVEALEAFESVRRREERDERETAQDADREESEGEPPEVAGRGPRSAGRSFRQSRATHEAPRRSRERARKGRPGRSRRAAAVGREAAAVTRAGKTAGGRRPHAAAEVRAREGESRGRGRRAGDEEIPQRRAAFRDRPRDRLGREGRLARSRRGRAQGAMQDQSRTGQERASRSAPELAQEIAPRAHSIPSSRMRLQRVLRLTPRACAARFRFQRWEASAFTIRSRLGVGGNLGRQGRAARRRVARRRRSLGPAELRREVLDLDRLARAERDRVFQRVLELADVSGPGAGLQHVQRVGRETQRPARAAADVREEVLGDEGDVLRPLAQRRKVDRDDAQAVVEVLAEAPRPDHLQEILVRRGDDPRVHHARRALADALELPLLQDAQELHLQVQRHVADLVEEDRAAARQLEPSDAVPHRSRERALHVAEELALEQVARQGPAVDRHERARRCGASSRAASGR